MSIMENYMKEGAATCHPLYFQLFKPMPSSTQISLDFTENKLTLQNQVISGWKLDLKDITSYIYMYVYIFFLPFSLCLFK